MEGVRVEGVRMEGVRGERGLSEYDYIWFTDR